MNSDAADNNPLAACGIVHPGGKAVRSAGVKNFKPLEALAMRP